MVKNPVGSGESAAATVSGITLSPTQRLTLRGAQHLARLLDSRFRILGVRFGLDPILGFIPGVGDVVTASLSAYMLLVALHMGVPVTKLLQIAALLGTDILVGLVPIAGDAADIVLKANSRSLRIIEDHIREREAGVEDSV